MNTTKFSFPVQMAIATLLGICVGLFFGQRCAILEPYASAYIMILKITAIPYLVVAIIHGIGLLNRAQAMQILKKGSIFIALALAINISVIYLMYWTYPAAEGPRQMGYVAKEIPTINFAELLIPENIFYNLANNIIPAVVVFCILIGISLMYLADKQVFMSTLQTLLDTLTKVTSWIARVTPIGTFIIMANQAGTIEIATIKQMSTYIILYIVGTMLVVFWIVPRLASILTPMKALTWLKNLVPVLILTYTTTLTIVALPYIINIIRREVQMLYPKDENVQSQVQGTVSVIFNLPFGSIFTAAFVFFTAVFFSVKLVVAEQLKLLLTTFLTCLGAVGLGSWINSLTFILDTLGLPIDAINLYLAVVPFTAGFQSMVSAMLISTLAFLIMLAGRGLLSFNWKKLVFGSTFTIIPVLLIFGGLKYFNPLPKIKNETKTIFDLQIASSTKVNIHTHQMAPAETPPNESTLQRIIRTKTLRVGYDPHSTPFCFFNNDHQLVGFDVAYAQQLAFDLGCEQIDFIPIIYKSLDKQLSDNVIDIAMSSISISETRMRQMCFPAPILEAKIVLITSDKNRKRLASVKKIQADHSITIAVPAHSAYEKIAYDNFPKHQIVRLEDFDAFDHGNPPADVLIWDEQEAIAWTTAHPQFEVVYPKPNLGVETLGYPIKCGDPEFLNYMNTWLTLKTNDGFKEAQYNLWIVGKTSVAAPAEPRWSILDNVLHYKKN